MITYYLLEVNKTLIENICDMVQKFLPKSKVQFKMTGTEESEEKFHFSSIDAN